MKEKKDLINVENLFTKISRYFGKSDFVQEAYQNAYRAGATTIEVVLDSTANSLSFKDNGRGISDIISSISLASSDWDEIVNEQDPAGMGIVSLLTACRKELIINSKFGTLTINKDKFFKYADYRKSLEPKERVIDESSEYTTEFLMDLDSDTKYSELYDDIYKTAKYSFLESVIVRSIPSRTQKVGEEPVIYEMYRIEVPAVVPSFYKDIAREPFKNYPFEYEGNYGMISLNGAFHRDHYLNYYGCRIDVPNLDKNDYLSFGYSTSFGFSSKLIVSNGSPLTPVLPNRHTFIKDEKYNRYTEALTKIAIVNLMIDINDSIELLRKKQIVYFSIDKMYTYLVANKVELPNNILFQKSKDNEDLTGLSLNEDEFFFGIPDASNDIYQIEGMDSDAEFRCDVLIDNDLEKLFQYPMFLKSNRTNKLVTNIKTSHPIVIESGKEDPNEVIIVEYNSTWLFIKVPDDFKFIFETNDGRSYDYEIKSGFTLLDEDNIYHIFVKEKDFNYNSISLCQRMEYYIGRFSSEEINNEETAYAMVSDEIEEFNRVMINYFNCISLKSLLDVLHIKGKWKTGKQLVTIEIDHSKRNITVSNNDDNESLVDVKEFTYV